MQLVEQRDADVSVSAACLALNVSRASLYRSRRPPAPAASRRPRVRAASPRRLDDAERQEILDTLHLPGRRQLHSPKNDNYISPSASVW
jgi:hypothetical protein